MVATRCGQGRLDFRRRARGFLRSASSAARRRSLRRGARPSRHLLAPNLFSPVASRLALTSRLSADRARALGAGEDARARARGTHPRPTGGAHAARRGRRRAAAAAESARVDPPLAANPRLVARGRLFAPPRFVSHAWQAHYLSGTGGGRPGGAQRGDGGDGGGFDDLVATSTGATAARRSAADGRASQRRAADDGAAIGRRCAAGARPSRAHRAARAVLARVARTRCMCVVSSLYV